MSKLDVVDSSGANTTIESEAVEALGSALRGPLLRRGDEGYDQAREIWNAMIDKRPAMIARCTGVADVRTSVAFAAKHGLRLSVRGGGHNIAGNAVCDGGLMIDLSLMKQVRVDPAARRAHVGPGATLGDLDHETQAFGLATPVGINSTTGVAGLTLGGGFGWLSRKYGMTIDNLVEADVVLADGSFVRASEKDNSDLFWALRGGGGNFGVVTRFEFQLHPVGPEVLSGLVVYPIDQARDVLEKYRGLAGQLGDETNIWVVMRQAPPLPFLPPDVHGKEIVVLAVFHAGDPAEGRKAIEPARHFGTVLGEHIGVQPYTAWQQAFDPLLTPGARNYWKSHNFTELKKEVVDAAVRATQNLPSGQTEIFFGLLGGAMGRVAPDATAYPHRGANLVMNVHGRWDDAGEDDRCIAWARDFFQETAPHASGGVYVNFLTEDEGDRVTAAYGASYGKLAAIKKKYDPSNLFRLNQNITPAP